MTGWAIWAVEVAAIFAAEAINQQQSHPAPVNSQTTNRPQPRAIQPRHERQARTSPPPRHIRLGTYAAAPPDMPAAEPALAPNTWGSISVAAFSPSTVPLTPFEWRSATPGDQQSSSSDFPASGEQILSPGIFSPLRIATSNTLPAPGEFHHTDISALPLFAEPGVPDYPDAVNTGRKKSNTQVAISDSRQAKLLASTCESLNIFGRSSGDVWQGWEKWLLNGGVEVLVGPDPGNKFGIHESLGRVIVTREWLEKINSTSVQNGVVNSVDVNTFELGKALYAHIPSKQKRIFNNFVDANTNWLADMKRSPSKQQKETDTHDLGDFVGEYPSAFGYAFRATFCDLPGGGKGQAVVEESINALSGSSATITGR